MTDDIAKLAAGETSVLDAFMAGLAACPDDTPDSDMCLLSITHGEMRDLRSALARHVPETPNET